MIRLVRSVAVAAFFLSLLSVNCSPPPETSPEPKKIVLISGPMDGHPQGSHEYEPTILLLKYLLDTSPSLTNVQTEAYFDSWPEDPSVLDEADVIVVNSAGTDQGLDYHGLYARGRFEQVKKRMERGCGLVMLHNSTVHPMKYHEPAIEWLGGHFDYETAEGESPYYSRVRNQEWNLVFPAPEHPISRGLSDFTIKEEVYFRMRFRDGDSRVQPILLKQADGPALENAISWAVEREDGGRGFSFTGGHYFSHWWNPNFRGLVLNGIVWAAGIEIPEGGIVSQLEDPIKMLVLTGQDHPAHDWEAVTVALIHALELDPRVKVNVTETIEDLAGEGIKEYDALVLNYNNWGGHPGLSAEARENLVNYLAAGGGLTAIHFASGAFNGTIPNNQESDWELFRTKILSRAFTWGESGHDPYGAFQVEVTPLNHPITDGVSGFETVDELYHTLAGDPSVEPLITAHSQKTGKEEPLAWAREYGSGRVFQTVLGHSDESIRKAATLIRRGTVWSAGRDPFPFDPPAVLANKSGLRNGSAWMPSSEEAESQ